VKSPCQAKPEMWTSDLASDRAEAAQICATACHRLRECAIEALTNPPELGVVAGVDYSPKPGQVGRPRGAALPPAAPRICERCGATYAKPSHDTRAKWSRRRFCSRACRDAREVHEPKVCSQCGSTFVNPDARPVRWAQTRYCSHSCAAASQWAS
jgi:hypothetical protein